MMEMKKIQDAVREMFERIEFGGEPSGLYDPLRYMIGIGGKRIRPTLCLLAYSLYADDFSPEILNPAAALEVFHTFTLIHDDIMDRSPLRRRMPTVWVKWSEDHAILSGDVMLIDAYKRISKSPCPRHNEVLSLFSETAAQVCEGQQYDMDFESLHQVPMEDYEKMIGLKTAVLLACSAQMGAIIAGAPQAECEALYRYGYELGMAFQVADDYLDAYGDEKVFGKPIGGDIINSKKSWLTVRALEKAADKESFLNAFEAGAATPEEKLSKIEDIRSRYDSLGVPEDAKAEIKRFSDKAIAELSGAGFGGAALEKMKDFADSLVGRVN